MEAISSDVSRRTLFMAGSAGALALAGFAGGAQAASSTAAEKANLKLVTEFCNSWNDPDKAATLLAPDSSVRMMEDAPPLIGPAAFTKTSKDYMGNGTKISVKILHTFTKGPVVVTVRVDTITMVGKPDQVFKVVGVFVVKNSLIKEWTDYIEA
ncbi:MAG: hypothetical protein EPO08_14835 [Rhodospirillaceae bacterium]|nr:MAG: hypothetical protein EPO08_14835 [Rhodospirillaceae bacterium]